MFQSWAPESVKVKFLEKGHTFMRADNIHGMIGKKMKRTSVITTFDDFIDLVRSAGKTIKPIVLDITNIFEVEKKARWRTTKSVIIPYLGDVVEVKFMKEDKNMYFKTSFKEKIYKACDFLMPRIVVTDFPEPTKQLSLPIFPNLRSNVEMVLLDV